MEEVNEQAAHTGIILLILSINDFCALWGVVALVG
jgi:hypothetical protein